jgi:HSP20 family molecular chaperone IbpA
MFSLLSAIPTESDAPEGAWLLDIRWKHHPAAWRPPTDVFETPEAIIVRVEIAGMRTEDFHLSLEAQTLVIDGIRRDPDPGAAYHRLEIPFGQFQVTIALPAMIDEQHVEAEYRAGFLRVRLPKRRARTIAIHPGR